MNFVQSCYDVSMVKKVNHTFIASLYLQGKPSNEVADLVNCSSTTVCKVARQNAIPIRGFGWISPEQKQQMVLAHQDGLRVFEIAKKFNRAYTTVHKVLSDAGVLVKRGYSKKRVPTEREIDEAANLYKQGKTIREIANDLGCSYSNLRSTFIATQVKIRSKHEATSLRMNKLNPNWGLGRKKTREGYVRVWCPRNPHAKKGYVREHVLVWEMANGPVPDGYVIHHLNGIKDDNRLENLVALPLRTHSQEARVKDLFIKKLQKRIRNLEGQANQLTLGGYVNE